MADIFVSYKREDREAVRRLVEALQARGWSVWWDTRIGAGESWDRVIERELEAAGCVVVAWSKASVESDWVRQEAREGRERGRLVPMTIDGTRPPLEFRSVQATDLARWRGDAADPAFLDVCGGVQRVLAPTSVNHAAGNTNASYDMAAALLASGDGHYTEGDYDRAVADYTKAIELDPNSADAYNSRGVAFYFKMDYDRAIADLTKAIGFRPKFGWAYCNRAQAFDSRGLANDADRAIADFRRAVELDPLIEEAREGLRDLGVTP